MSHAITVRDLLIGAALAWLFTVGASYWREWLANGLSDAPVLTSAGTAWGAFLFAHLPPIVLVLAWWLT